MVVLTVVQIGDTSGRDIARRLIEAAYTFADQSEAASVYWLTQEYNAPARSL